MCDYLFTYTLDGEEMRKACQRASQFWVQSLLSTHNMHACAHHLARIVREVDQAVIPYDLGDARSKADQTDKRYRKFGTHPDDDGRRLTGPDSNYARVTVKVYEPKGR